MDVHWKTFVACGKLMSNEPGLTFWKIVFSIDCCCIPLWHFSHHLQNNFKWPIDIKLPQQQCWFTWIEAFQVSTFQVAAPVLAAPSYGPFGALGAVRASGYSPRVTGEQQRIALLVNVGGLLVELTG